MEAFKEEPRHNYTSTPINNEYGDETVVNTRTTNGITRLFGPQGYIEGNPPRTKHKLRPDYETHVRGISGNLSTSFY